MSILKQLTEPKVATSAPDLLGGLRRWRRLMSRSLELHLALPDPIILSGWSLASLCRCPGKTWRDAAGLSGGFSEAGAGCGHPTWGGLH